MDRSGVRLAAFDLDGTLTRGDTVVEAFARQLGRLERARAFERLRAVADLTAAREEMAAWLVAADRGALLRCLADVPLAPGAADGIALLQGAGVRVAIVSITWEFAVAWFAARLGVDLWLGTRLRADGGVAHVWPDDKAHWLLATARRLGLARSQLAAVGDSWGDAAMLRLAGHAYFVGPTLPPDLTHATHLPAGDLLAVARAILAAR